MTRLAAILVALTTILLAGCGSVNTMRQEFVALRYMQQAEAKLTSYPQDTARAVNELDRAVALMPDDEDLKRRAARFYTAARAWEKAVPLFEDQQHLDRKDRLAFARCLLHVGRRDEGAQICLSILSHVDEQRERVGGMRPEWALLLNDAGYILADADMHLDRAHNAVAAAVEFMPLEGAFIDSLGWALYRKGELKDAAFYLERSRRHITREDPEILYHLGVVYSRLGRYRDAADALQRARELSPHWEAVQKELRRLGRILPPPVLAACRPGPSPSIDHGDEI